MHFLSNPIQHKLFQNASASATKLGSMAEEAMDDERRRLEQFRSWHDEAFLYINQVGRNTHCQVAKCAKLIGEWLARDHQTPTRPSPRRLMTSVGQTLPC